MMGQSKLLLKKGKISFISSKNVYVKFSSTEDINVNDTLYVIQNGDLTPALRVDNKSSSSTVCSPLLQQKYEVGTDVIAQIPVKKEIKEEVVEQIQETPNPVLDPIQKDPEDAAPVEDVLFKEKVKGRISIASYNNTSSYRTLNRMRYAFMYRGYNLNNSRLSVETYLTFRHTLGEWAEVQENFFNAFKVYGLSLKYDFNKSTNLTFGRKINPGFSSIGAIDGLQFEKGLGDFRLGIIAGTRPNFRDYSFDSRLPQIGAYLSFISPNPANYSQTTLGVVEQRNAGNTDRRFVYFQHSGQLGKHLNLFGSAELDLYENINNEVRNNVQLTNLYASLRYRIGRKVRLSFSYDNRKNIIYYESYKNFIDQYIDDETRQGFRFGISHRVSRKISWGANTNLRFQKSKENPSRHASAYVSISKVPFLNVRAMIRANYLQTDFLDSRIMGARFSRDIIPGKLSTEVYYRWVDYLYKNSNRTVHQDIAGLSLSWRIQKKISLNLYYEGVFSTPEDTYHRFNMRLIKRF
jgi:hypothetical protein